jgi:hypothetical protein
LIVFSGLVVCSFLTSPAASTRAAPFALSPLDYDIVYVRVPRPGDNTNSFWPDATTPLFLDAAADLMLLTMAAKNSFGAGVSGAVVDPYVSYDARRWSSRNFPNFAANPYSTRADSVTRSLATGRYIASISPRARLRD